MYPMRKPLQFPLRPTLLRPNLWLKEAREQYGWSQQELADQLGITANSVSRWERGASSPIPHYRRQLCKLFAMSPEALGLLHDRRGKSTEPLALMSPGFSPRLPTIWQVPLPRNPFFTGRQEVLEHLAARMRAQCSQASP